MKYVLLICAIFLSLVITFDLFLKEPPVWSDEGGLAKFSIQAGKDPLSYYYFYPSVYIVILSSWFNLFGVSIVNQRLFSILGGLLTIIIFCYILKNLGFKNSLFKIIGIVLLITDFTFLQSTRIGRPEIWTLFFGLLSIYFYLKYINSEFKKYIFFILSLFSSIVAFLFHMNGIIFTLVILIVSTINYKKIITQKYKNILIPSIIILPILVWIGSRFLFFLSYILLRLKIGIAQDTWLISVFTQKPLELKLIYLSFILIFIMFIIFYFEREYLAVYCARMNARKNLSHFCGIPRCLQRGGVHFKKQNNKLLLITLSLIFSWALAVSNKDFWYAVFPVPFVVLALIILLEHYSNNRSKFIGLTAVLVMLLLSNAKFHFDILMFEGGDKYSYEKFVAQIQKNIPDNKTVFNSSIPDTYFAFTDRKNKYEGFPQGFTDVNYYIDVLSNTDFIIYNGSYGDNYYGNIVAKYIDKNKLNIVKIGEPNQYQAYIVELKPKNERSEP